jgi:hypothetical protein
MPPFGITALYRMPVNRVENQIAGHGLTLQGQMTVYCDPHDNPANLPYTFR